MIQHASESVVIGETGGHNQPAREIGDARERGEDQCGAGSYSEGDLAAAHVVRGFAEVFWGVGANEVAGYHLLFPFWGEEEGGEVVGCGEERGDKGCGEEPGDKGWGGLGG